MSDALQLILCNPDSVPEQAQRAIKAQLFPYCMQAWARGVDRLVMTVMPAEDAKSVAQRRYYHGVVLTEIAEQARANGQRFPMPVWKEFLREKFLGSTWKVITNPITGKKSRRKVRVSTEDLGIRAYSKLIEQVTAFAATELGVRFSVTESEYRP